MLIQWSVIQIKRNDDSFKLEFDTASFSEMLRFAYMYIHFLLIKYVFTKINWEIRVENQFLYA